MQNYSDFMPLKRLFETFDWLPISEILGKTRFSSRGRKNDFSNLNLFKAFVLKSYLLIDDNTVLVKRFHENKQYREFCSFQKIPSHDTLSRFERKFSNRFIKIFEFLDDLLEKNGAFENDDMSFDGTDIPVLVKNKRLTTKAKDINTSSTF